MSATAPKVIVGAQGRIVLPAEIRRELGIKTGDELMPIVQNGELTLLTHEQIIKRIQALSAHGRRDVSAVDELIAWRREEFRREEAELRRYGA